MKKVTMVGPKRDGITIPSPVMIVAIGYPSLSLNRKNSENEKKKIIFVVKFPANDLAIFQNFLSSFLAYLFQFILELLITFFSSFRKTIIFASYCL